ncbi:MAG: hypothetical protein R3190_14185, partial [Thermoanaerobaculia bacterium]|nr:hypothetical protein [Thermoanaerobaculia bacterium]
DGDAVEAVAGELVSLASAARRRMTVEKIDGRTAAETPLGSALLADSFVTGYRGITYRPAGTARRIER